MGLLETLELDREVEGPAMLPVGGSVSVQPRDGAGVGRDDALQLRPIPPSTESRAPRRASEDGVPAVEEPPDLLVGRDPAWDVARVPEHPVRKRILAGRAVVIERQGSTPMWQIVELAVLHGLADLTVDEGLPGVADLPCACVVASSWTHPAAPSSIARERYGGGLSTVRHRYEHPRGGGWERAPCAGIVRGAGMQETRWG